MANMEEIVVKSLESHQDLFSNLLSSNLEVINKVGDAIIQTISKGGTVFWCGNGGSAADSQHLAAELVGRYNNDRPPLRSVALSTDTSIITAVSNDYHYNEIFSRQIKALGRSGDLLVVISTSGNSQSIINVINAAQELGVITVGLLGKGGGQAKSVVDLPVVVPSNLTPRIQEAHIFIGHCLCEILEAGLGFDGDNKWN